MSGQRQARGRGAHAPFRKATPTRQSASGPGDRIANARDVAIYFREDCRPLRDSLQLEMVVAQYVLRMRDVRTPEGVPIGDATSAGVVAELERHGDELSHAILRGLAHLGSGHTASRSADAAARLAERGTGMPANFGDVGAVRTLGAWRQSEGGHAGEYVFFAEFEHPLHGRRHSLALFVEPRRGGVVKHIGLLGPMDELAADEPFHLDAMEALEIEAAGELLAELLERSHGQALDGSDDYRVVIAAARARSMKEQGAVPHAA
jgi:hypothetical protein